MAIAACIPFALLWMFPAQLRSFAMSIVAVALFGSNVLFSKEEGYFAASAELKPLLHTWSLAVEEQFYLFPILLLIVWRAGRNWMMPTLAVMALASLAMSEWGWRSAPTANFYLPPFRAWELLAGSLSAIVLHRREPYRNELAAAAGLAAIGGSIFLSDESTPFPGLYAAFPVVGAALILIFGSPDTKVARLLAVPPLVGIGLISYSAYLWHQPLFAFARLRSIVEPSPALMAGLIAVTLGLAWLSWRFVEQPFRRRGQGLMPTRKSLFAASPIGMSAFLAIGITAVVLDGVPARFSLPPGVARKLSQRIGEGDCVDRTIDQVAKASDRFCRRGRIGSSRLWGCTETATHCHSSRRWSSGLCGTTSNFASAR